MVEENRRVLWRKGAGRTRKQGSEEQENTMERGEIKQEI